MVNMNLQRMYWLEAVYDKCKVGEQLYNIIISEKKPGTGIVFSPANVGDTVWLAVLAEEYKRIYNYERLIFIVKERQTEIIKMFPAIDEVLPLNDEQIWDLRYYIMVKRLYNQDDFRYGHFPADLNWELPHIMHCLNCEDDVLEHMWETVLGIPFGSAKSSIKFPRINYSEEQLAESFGNAVLLMPGSATVVGIPVDFWMKLAGKLQDRGIMVYINYAGLPHDMLVDGVSTLQTSFDEIVVCSLYFKAIIGIRSGICDLLALTQCNLNVLYPDKNASDVKVEDGVLTSDVRDLLNDETDAISNYWYNEKLEDELIELLVENACKESL